jgi:hypothetical protein
VDVDAHPIVAQQTQRIHEIFHAVMTPKAWFIMELHQGIRIVARGHPDTPTFPHISFRDRSTDHFGGFIQLLSFVQELHVHRGQVWRLLGALAAAQNMVRDGLASIKRLVLFGNNSDAEDLLPWLRSRS